MVHRFTQAGAVEMSCQRVEIGQVLPAAGAGQVGIHEPQNADLAQGVPVLVELRARAVMNP